MSLRVLVWAEPTMVTLALGDRELEHDGAIAGTVLRTPGGSAFATAHTLAAAGIHTDAFVPVPATVEGRACIEMLEGVGAQVSALPASDLRETVVFVSPHGVRSMVGDKRNVFGPPYADNVPDVAVNTCDILYLSLSSLVADSSKAVSRLVRRAQNHDALVVVDAGSVGVVQGVEREVAALLETSIVLANKAEARALVARQIVSETLIVKNGPEPTELFQHGEVVEFPVSHVVKTVDSTGAGDAFAAGVVACLARRRDIEDAIRGGHDVARLCVSSLGTVPQPRDVATWANDMFSRSNP